MFICVFIFSSNDVTFPGMKWFVAAPLELKMVLFEKLQNKNLHGGKKLHRIGKISFSKDKGFKSKERHSVGKYMPINISYH